MSAQPLLQWRKETAKRAPNAIENLDEFKRNMASVMYDRTVTPTGVTLFHNRYSCNEMGEIASEFERGNYIPRGDVTAKRRRRTSDPHRSVTSDGKIKFDPDNLGHLYLWIPYGTASRWVKLHCTNPDMIDMPLWLHQKAMEQGNLEAHEFCSAEKQSMFLAKLYNAIASSTEKAPAKQLKLLGRALDDPRVQSSLARHVEVRPELPSHRHVDADEPPFGAPDLRYDTEPSKLAGNARKDALETTPRPGFKTKPRPKTWAQLQRSNPKINARRHQPAAAPKKRNLNSPPNRQSKGLSFTWKEVS